MLTILGKQLIKIYHIKKYNNDEMIFIDSDDEYEEDETFTGLCYHI